MKPTVSLLIGLSAGLWALATTASSASAQATGQSPSESWGAVHAAYQQALKETDPTRVAGDLPPLALARARLLLAANPQEAAYQGWLAYYRMQWDAYHCTDPSAAQGLAAIVTEMHGADPDFLAKISQPELKLAAFRRLLAEDAVFAAPSRPWWICSHGASVTTAVPRPGWSRPDSELAEQREGWRNMVQGTITQLEAAAPR